MVFLGILFIMAPAWSQGSTLTEPAGYFGFQPGSDRNLFTYEQLISYLMKLDGESERIHMEEIGKSPEGRSMYIAFISAEENLRNLDTLQVYNRELALNDHLGEKRLEQLVSKGKVFVLATLSMHSSEVGPSQSAPLIAYDLASTEDPEKLECLNNVVYMMVPCHNPDGMDYVVENYKKYLGTPNEGADLPRVYHKYVGHDNNRDFVILTQDDNRAVARIYNQTWFPQVMVEKHQMGSTGPRLFVPPNHDPIAENVPAGIYQWAGVFGQHMVTEMTAEGLAGISQHYQFDDYWPGSTETCIWKNVIGMLTEAASAHYATPIYIEPSELDVRGKGLSEYKKSVNMLEPWKGGWWRLGDIVDLETGSTMSILRTASLYREDILRFRNRMCREQVALGRNEAPYYYILPADQHDQGELVNLVNLMKEHGIDVYTLEGDVVLEGRVFRGGDVVIPLAQPFRSFIKEVMETQEYPERHYTPDGELIKPYDITSWSLPLHRQVESHEISSRSSELEALLTRVEGSYTLAGDVESMAHSMVLTVNSNESYRAAFLAVEKGLDVQRLNAGLELKEVNYPEGSFIVRLDPSKKEAWQAVLEELPFRPGFISDKRALHGTPVKMPRIALVETYFQDMDAGWTRYLFDSYHIPYRVLHPEQIAKAGLADNFDVVIFPDNPASVLMTGKYKSGESYYMRSFPPEYVKGMEKEGMAALMSFMDDGGIILAWGRSAGLFEGILKVGQKEGEEEFQLPFSDLSSDLAKKGLFLPGSLVNVDLAEHPLTLGLPSRIGVFSRGRPVFQTSVPIFDTDRRVIATYPEKDILLSGYGEHTEEMGNTAAMIWLRKGNGQFVLYGFGPQFRASTQASYKLLFNALLLEKLE
jgi:hypothetical protein